MLSKIILLLIFIWFLIGPSSFASCPLPEGGSLDINIIPGCRTPNDSITIKVKGYFTNNCWTPAVLDSYAVGDTIKIYTSTTHTPDSSCLQESVFFSLDVPLGLLPEGFYAIMLFMELNSPVYPSPETCKQFFSVDSLGYTPGDINSDGKSNLGDLIGLYRFIMQGRLILTCDKAGDANGDCGVDIGDCVYLANYLFKGEPAPVPYCSNPQTPTDPGEPDTIYITYGDFSASCGYPSGVPLDIYLKTDNNVQAFSIPLDISGTPNIKKVDTTELTAYSGTAVSSFDLLSINTYPYGLNPTLPTKLVLGGLDGPFFETGLNPGLHKIGRLCLEYNISEPCPYPMVFIDSFSAQYFSLELVEGTNTIAYAPVFRGFKGPPFFIDPCYLFLPSLPQAETFRAGTQGQIMTTLVPFFCPLGWAKVSYKLSPLPPTSPVLDTTLNQAEDSLYVTLSWTPCLKDTGTYTLELTVSPECPDTVIITVVPPENISTLRGDANSDGKRNITDVIYMVNYVFKGGCSPLGTCLGDANNDSQVNLADIVFLVNFVFRGGPAPSPDC